MLLASVSRIKGSWKSGYVKMGVDVNHNFNSANAEAQSFVQLNGLSCSVKSVQRFSNCCKIFDKLSVITRET